MLMEIINEIRMCTVQTDFSCGPLTMMCILVFTAKTANN